MYINKKFKGNSALIVLIKVVNKYCPIKCTSANLEPLNFLQMFVSLETALVLPVLIYYLGLKIFH